MADIILVIGGSDHIGSYFTLKLLDAGFRVVVMDTQRILSAEFPALQETTCGAHPLFIEGDVHDADLLEEIFANFNISAVCHLASQQTASDNMKLCQAMARAGIFRLMLSSSATVYGETAQMPIREDFPAGQSTNAYDCANLMIEKALRDLALSDPRWSIVLLRYFNPVGAHEGVLVGEYSNGTPSELLSYVAQMAVGKLREQTVLRAARNDDGARDYIHMVDLVGDQQAMALQSGLHV